MARSSLSLPHERRKAMLKAAKITSKIKIAEHREKIGRINNELAAMQPKKDKERII